MCPTPPLLVAGEHIPPLTAVRHRQKELRGKLFKEAWQPAVHA